MSHEIVINIEEMLWLLGGIATAITTATLIYKYLPTTKLQQIVEQHEKLLKMDNEHLNKIDAQLKEIQDSIHQQQTTNKDEMKILLKSVYLLMKNANGSADADDLKDSLKEMEDFLVALK